MNIRASWSTAPFSMPKKGEYSAAHQQLYGQVCTCLLQGEPSKNCFAFTNCGDGQLRATDSSQNCAERCLLSSSRSSSFLSGPLRGADASCAVAAICSYSPCRGSDTGCANKRQAVGHGGVTTYNVDNSQDQPIRSDIPRASAPPTQRCRCLLSCR